MSSHSAELRVGVVPQTERTVCAKAENQNDQWNWRSGSTGEQSGECGWRSKQRSELVGPGKDFGLHQNRFK